MKKGSSVTKKKTAKKQFPIKHWSHSSLMAFLRNPLAWYVRYVAEIYDTPRTPSAIVGSAAHKALEHFYSDVDKETAILLGLEYLRGIDDADIDFGKVKTKKKEQAKRTDMEREYLQAISFYLAKPPKHRVLGVEVKGIVSVKGLPLPLKAVADLVVNSRIEYGSIDIVDHKFVASFSPSKAAKPIFAIQAIFNYYVMRELFGKPVRRFIVYECKKSKNANGAPQLRKYILDFKKLDPEFTLFNKLITDATKEIARQRLYLPNPSDMFEGDRSIEIYRLGLID